MVLAMPSSAIAAYVVLRRWDVWAPAAALGGLIYGFSPYAVGASLAHLVLVFLPFVPFIVLTVVDILCGRGTPWRKGILLGLLVAAEYLCAPEILASVIVLTVWGSLCAAVRYRDRVGTVARRAWPALATAVATSAAVIAYPIWMMLRGPQHYTGPAQPPGKNSTTTYSASSHLGPYSGSRFSTSSLGEPGATRRRPLDTSGFRCSSSPWCFFGDRATALGCRLRSLS